MAASLPKVALASTADDFDIDGDGEHQQRAARPESDHDFSGRIHDAMDVAICQMSTIRRKDSTPWFRRRPRLRRTTEAGIRQARKHHLPAIDNSVIHSISCVFLQTEIRRTMSDWISHAITFVVGLAGGATIGSLVTIKFVRSSSSRRVRQSDVSAGRDNIGGDRINYG